MAGSSGEEEEEEYEEIEVEEEVEEEEEYEEEEVDNDPEEEEEDPEEVEEEDKVVEEEYEEVEEEIEEEVEVEEEVTDEDGDVEMTEAKAKDEGRLEEMIESAVGSSDLSAPVAADCPPTDALEHMEPKGDEGHLRSGYPNTVKTEGAVPCDVNALEAIRPLLGSFSPHQQRSKGKRVATIEEGSSAHPTIVKDVGGPLNLERGTVKDEQGHAKWIVPVAATVKNVEGQKTAVGVPEIHISVSDWNIDQLGKVKNADIKETRLPNQEADCQLPSNEEVDQKASRFCSTKVRPRSLPSPGGECEAGNKRIAMICEFFAKGWCIKGSSCRFLHKRDHTDISRGLGGNMLSTKMEAWSSTGSGDATGALKLPGCNQLNSSVTRGDDLLPASTTGRHTQKVHGEGLHEKDKIDVLEREISSPLLSTSSQRLSSSRDGFRVVSSPKEAEADTLREKYSSDHLDSYDSSIGAGGSIQRREIFPEHGSFSGERGVASGPDSNYRLSSYAIMEKSSAMRRYYADNLHSSPNCGLSKKFDSGLRHAPLVANSLKDLLVSYKHKRKFTPYNWEPSIPYRPSYPGISLGTSSSGAQYDPLRDSIEQPDVGHSSLRYSSYVQTQGSVYLDVPSLSGRNSLGSPNRLGSDVWDRSSNGNDKDIRAVEAESAAISATADNKNIISDEEKPLVAVSVKDVLKATRGVADGNSRALNDETRLKEGKVEKGRKTTELDEEESRVIKVFRAALIEFVKELMKPVWHEGRLSKDVYKVIVQKAEDKILSTLPSNEVPNTSESIKLYLSSSRPKILKLIQAYVDKYANF